MQLQGKHFSPKHEMMAQLEETLPFVHCYSALSHSKATLNKSKICKTVCRETTPSQTEMTAQLQPTMPCVRHYSTVLHLEANLKHAVRYVR